MTKQKVMRKSLWRNAPLIAVIIAMNLAAECYGSGYVFQTVRGNIPYTSIPLAWAEATMLLGCSLLSTILMTRSALFAADSRPEQRKRASVAMAASLAAAAVSMGFCANGLAFQEQTQAHVAYIASPLAADDQRVLADPMSDKGDRDDARNRVKDFGVAPTKAELGPSHVLLALWLFGVALASARAGTLAEPETPAQARAREGKERAARAAETRRVNSALKAVQDKKVRKTLERSARRAKIPNVLELVRK